MLIVGPTTGRCAYAKTDCALMVLVVLMRSPFQIKLILMASCTIHTTNVFFFLQLVAFAL